METKSKRTAYLVMFIAFAIVVLGVGAYAYVLNSAGVGDVLNASTVTAKESTFTSYHDGELTFNISASQMSQMEVSTDPIATDNATMTVELSSSSDYESTMCTYDVVWVWDSDANNRYVASDVSLPYVAESGVEYPYEFSVQLNDGQEIDLSDFTWSDDGSSAVILDDQIITSASPTEKTTQNYEVTIRMYNIEAAQKNLFDKQFKAHIEMQNYECVTDVITDGTMHYYVKQDDGSYLEVQESALAVTEASGLNFYFDEAPTVNEDLSYCKRNGGFTHNGVGNTFDSNIENDECYIYLDEVITLPTLAVSITNSAGLTTGTGQVVEENGFRFQGVNPNNYICFGSDATTCPDDNLYRIIGAFETSYDSDGDEIAESSAFLAKIQSVVPTTGEFNSGSTIPMYAHYPNTSLYTKMNTTIYEAIDSSYKAMIVNAKWHLGAIGNTISTLTSSDFYAQERGTNVNAGVTEYEKVFKIGLMYPSDYGYAVLESNCARDTALTSYVDTDCSDLNWTYVASKVQWTISPQIHDTGAYPIVVYSNGGITASSAYSPNYIARQAFYLNADVKVTDGSGTSTDPYRISL